MFKLIHAFVVCLMLAVGLARADPSQLLLVERSFERGAELGEAGWIPRVEVRIGHVGFQLGDLAGQGGDV